MKALRVRIGVIFVNEKENENENDGLSCTGTRTRTRADFANENLIRIKGNANIKSRAVELTR